MHVFLSNLANGQTDTPRASLSEVNEQCQEQQASPRSHCRVLPPGEFNSMVPIPLPICREGFITTAVRLLRRYNVLRSLLSLLKYGITVAGHTGCNRYPVY